MQPHRHTLVKDKAGAPLLCEVRLQPRAEAAVLHATGLHCILPQLRPPLLHWHLGVVAIVARAAEQLSQGTRDCHSACSLQRPCCHVIASSVWSIALYERSPEAHDEAAPRKFRCKTEDVRPVILLPAAVLAQGNLCGLIGVVGSVRLIDPPASVRLACHTGQDLSSRCLHRSPCRQRRTPPLQRTAFNMVLLSEERSRDMDLVLCVPGRFAEGCLPCGVHSVPLHIWMRLCQERRHVLQGCRVRRGCWQQRVVKICSIGRYRSCPSCAPCRRMT